MSDVYAPLRALVWRKPAPIAPRTFLRDPRGDAITDALREADLWRDTASVELTSCSERISVRVFLPERAQGARDGEREIAQRTRAVIAAVLLATGHRAIFTDALWCDKPRGWSVIGTARQSAGTEAGA